MAVIPFYGAEQPDIFAIERRAMDRSGLVIDALDVRLPRNGCLLLMDHSMRDTPPGRISSLATGAPTPA
ncbi:MAG: hypothetical protein IIC71_12890 [Acidobacteria bacterium]|nr:hypothetical protein [Acidobacteriota bacterium]